MIKEIKVNIEKYELCPCGSGKIYNECCKRLKDEFYSLGKNYNGKDIIFNKSKVNNIYDEIAQYALDNIFSLEKDEHISVSKGIDFLSNIYLKVDKGINEYEKYAPCKKGCSKCCCLYLECTAIEAENIRRYILNNKNEDEIENLEKNIKKNFNKIHLESMPHELNKEERNKLSLLYFKEKIPCVFLNREGACSIYSVRPLSCRKFIVFTSEDSCSSKEKIIRPNLPPAYISSLAIDGICTSIIRYKKLSFLNDKNILEGIKRPLLFWFKNGFSDINREL